MQKVLKASRFTFEGEISSKIDKKAEKIKILEADSNITLVIICQKVLKLWEKLQVDSAMAQLRTQ